MQSEYKLSKSFFLMFALLPVMIELTDVVSAAKIGALVCGAWWLTRILFRIGRPLFPASLFKTAIIFWIASLGQIAWYYLQISPLWIGSLTFLLFYEGIEKRLFGDSWFQTIVSGIMFIGLLILISALELLAGMILAVESFHHSFGFLLILGVIAAVISKRKIEKNYG